MKTNREPESLPVRGRLSLAYISSILISVLMLVASIAGLRYRAGIYPTGELIRSFVPNDAVNLLVGLPILLGSMLLTWCGKLLGLLCWPGALLFVVYNYLAYVFAMPLNWLFLLHLAMVVLTVYTLIGLSANMDGDLIQQRLSGNVPERFAGGVLAGLGVLFLMRGMSVLVSAIYNGTGLPETQLAINMADFLTIPAWVMGGVLLWRKHVFGYVFGLGLLFQGSMLFIALIGFLLLQPVLTSAPFVITDVLVIFAMGSICFIPFALFVRGLTTDFNSKVKRRSLQ